MRISKALLLALFIASLISACNKESLNPTDNSIISENIGKVGSVQSGTELLVPSQYSTIQAAVNAANDGDIVKVSSGTYAEKVVIRDLDNIKIIGDDATITVPSGGMTGTLLKTVNCENILIKGFTIDGKNGVGVSAGASNGGGDADTRFYGLFAINTSGKIENNIINDISLHNFVHQFLLMYFYFTYYLEGYINIFFNNTFDVGEAHWFLFGSRGYSSIDKWSYSRFQKEL